MKDKEIRITQNYVWVHVILHSSAEGSKMSTVAWQPPPVPPHCKKSRQVVTVWMWFNLERTFILTRCKGSLFPSQSLPWFNRVLSLLVEDASPGTRIVAGGQFLCPRRDWWLVALEAPLYLLGGWEYEQGTHKVFHHAVPHCQRLDSGITLAGLVTSGLCVGHATEHRELPPASSGQGKDLVQGEPQGTAPWDEKWSLQRGGSPRCSFLRGWARARGKPLANTVF